MQSVALTRKILSCFLFTCMLAAGCKKKEKIPPPPAPSSGKEITSFIFKQADNAAFINADVTGTFTADTILLVVPAETDITALKPAVSFTGKSVSPADGAVQNFSAPVTYTVTAEDGSTKKYVVAVNFRSTVFFNSLDGSQYAFDAKTGQLIWRLNNGQFDTGTPSVYNGVLYSNARDGFYAVDAKTGVQKWRFPIPASGSGGAVFTSSPVVANNVAYVSAFDGYVYALNTADGSLKWKTRSTSGQPFVSSVTLNNGILYAGCSDSVLYAFNAATGSVAWKFNAPRPVYVNPLAVNNNICIEAFASNWYLLNGTTGAVIWTGNSIGNMSSPTIDNGRIYSGGGNRGNALDINTGQQLWLLSNNPGGNIYSERPSPVISDGKYYACSNDGNCYAFDIATKTRLWVYQTAEVNPTNIFGSPVLSEGLLYFGNNNGVLYAVNAATGTLVWRGGTSNGIYGSAVVVDKNGAKHYPAISGEQQ